MKKKEKQFIKKPQPSKEQDSFDKIVKENLKYPEEAVKNNIEGTVYLEYRVNDNGEIEDVCIIKGLGYGCDEEAIRIVKLLKFDKVKNRGVRVKTNYKAKIQFKLPTNTKINYTFLEQKDAKNNINKQIYNYSIRLDQKN